MALVKWPPQNESRLRRGRAAEILKPDKRGVQLAKADDVVSKTGQAHLGKSENRITGWVLGLG